MKEKFPPIPMNTARFGMKNGMYQIGCPTENFMRDEQFKKKMSEKIRKTYEEGRVHPLVGKETTQHQKEQTAKANSRSYEISFPNGDKKVITNMKKFCEENGYSDIVFHRYQTQGKAYHGMSYRKL
jgi:hypothetical protein